MRPIRWGVGGILLAGALAHPGGAQSCPFSLQTTVYAAGSGCGLALGAAVNGGPCAVTFALPVPPPSTTCSITIPFLILGTQAAAVPLPAGCALLAAPDLVVGMTLNPSLTAGTLTFPLPPDPALVGISAYAQGVGFRICNPGGGVITSSEGLLLAIV
ncbi:MAG: hypothetical protein L0323_22405 [Planctomycetes bacterium]|nr:hypothetical protein [Planctomycetota bacterium]